MGSPLVLDASDKAASLPYMEAIINSHMTSTENRFDQFEALEVYPFPPLPFIMYSTVHVTYFAEVCV